MENKISTNPKADISFPGLLLNNIVNKPKRKTTIQLTTVLKKPDLISEIV